MEQIRCRPLCPGMQEEVETRLPYVNLELGTQVAYL